ncbi:capsular polysaccharide synthesis enzyme CapK [Xenorhabdus beddingii]|uniref:Capsular polysaccharide synthesis enzyme CapK n=1 Tax=Xenorhabdus beddingii TaxID=40578 RepID=A0A1Y2SJS8_9GAMM|nr:oligosaccharide flippase family protein [Xenorhabdus beddingii]OTA19170.1 capsular polysaccharide synthesis enzyme CapK [Xenorhabdus beddingii]
MTLRKKIKTLFELIGGNALSQILIIISMPFIIREYSPQDFGILAIINSIVIIIGVIGLGRYDQLIYKYTDRKNWIRCYSNGIFILITLSSLVLIASIISYNIFNISSAFLFIAPLLFSFSSYQIYCSILSLEQHYRVITISNITRSVILVIGQFCLSSYSSLGLITGLLLSQVLSLLIVAVFCHFNLKYHFSKRVDFFDFKDAVFSSSQSLANSFSSELPTIFIPYQFGLILLGYYNLAVRLTQLPITFFSNAIRPFIMGELNKNKNNKEVIHKRLIYGSLILLFLSVIGIFLINILSEDFFILYAGKEWSISGHIASALSFWLLVAFANIIATSYMTIDARFKELFYYDSLLLLTRAITVILCYVLSIEFIRFIYLYSIVGMLFNLFIIFYAMYISKKNKFHKIF